MALRLKREIEEYIENRKINQLLQTLEEAVTDADISEDDLLEYSKACKVQGLKLFDSVKAWGPKGLLIRCLEVDGREAVAIDLLSHDKAIERATDQLKPFILHVAVARRRTRFVHKLLDQLTKEDQKDFVNLSGTTSPGLKKKEMPDFIGKTPLCIAALNNDLKMVHILFRKGANLEAKGNSAGNNTIHNIIRYWKVFASRNPDDNCQNQQDLGHLIQEIIRMQKIREGTSGVAKLLFHKNDEGFTPLHLATQLGAYEVVPCITHYPDVYKITVSNDMLSNTFAYDVTEIDTAEGRINVLQLLQGYDDEQPVQAFDIVGDHPICDVIKFKGNAYKVTHRLWMLLHGFIMILFTWGLTERRTSENMNLTGNNTNASLVNATVVEITRFLDSYTGGPVDYVWYVSGFMLIVYAAILFVLEICSLRNSWCPCSCRQKPCRLNNVFTMFTVTLASDKPYRVWFMLFSISCFMGLFVRFFEYNYDNHTVSAVLVSGWWCMLQFSRGVGKLFSLLTAMIDRLIFQDLVIFCSLYYFILFGFSFSMTLAFQNADDVPENFQYIGRAMLTMFKLSLGLTEVDVLQKARHPTIATTIYVIYTIVSHVLLLNLLLTMFTESHNFMSKHELYLNTFQKLSVILTIDKRLPPCFRKLCRLTKEQQLVLQKNKNYEHSRQYVFVNEHLEIKDKFKRIERHSRSNQGISETATSSQEEIKAMSTSFHSLDSADTVDVSAAAFTTVIEVSKEQTQTKKLRNQCESGRKIIHVSGVP